MELNLKSAFFWPTNSTIVRTVKFSAALFWQRSIYRVLWRFAPGRAIDRAVRQLLTPPRHAFSDAELATLEEASLMPVPLMAGRLIAWRWGRARDPAVVLVHGWGGRGTQLRGFIDPLLKRGYSVVAYDAPGHGMSGGGESSLPQILQALNALLDHLGPVRAIVGHSVGGAMASIALAQRPEIERAVLIAPPASLIDHTQRIAAALRWPEALRAAIRRRIERRFGMNWSEFEAESARGEQPLLVIHDAADREVAMGEGLRHARNWPRGRLLQTSGLGHRRVLEDRLVIEATVDFVSGFVS
ncbi:MAG: alpha/beta fold hydrolase [Burkholderiaceae bacterium]|nr:alpha/beta fold hydrolase [Sulfuritalea sp.]MCF8175714.1 alpha/beta fold hydrolase [Burkholderiaceae bacterium]MCF8183569.1 alpha/beta fold hydrolase [Polynucleobacter sp.]